MVNTGGWSLQIFYASKELEQCFSDQRSIRQILPADWGRTLWKHLLHLKAADCFGDILDLHLGRPEILKGYKQPHGSLRIAGNVRLIIRLEATHFSIRDCTEIEVKGVCDYHGGKDNWYIR